MPEREDDPYRPAIIDRIGIHALIAAAYRSTPTRRQGRTPLSSARRAESACSCTPSTPNRAHGVDPALKTARHVIDVHFVCLLAAVESPLRPEPIPLIRTARYQLDTILSAADPLNS